MRRRGKFETVSTPRRGLMTRAVFLGLLLCVPLQLWLAWDLRDPNRTLKEQFVHIRRLFVDSLDWWRRWYFQSINTVRSLWRRQNNIHPRNSEECPAKEVELYRMAKGFFGQSPDIRQYRPEYLSYRVGQVVKHQESRTPGVIIAWDIYGRAPEEWLVAKYGDNQEMRREPHYRILLGQPDLKEVYIPQRQISVLKATQVNNPKVAELFSLFDGAQYIPREPLSKKYPLD